ncbi:hypothetical protein [Bacillus sp. BP-3]|uniref:hypothetical protein n=1 Tax=Bacillus sp. BP-3 TaxID=3022773 RepID=UPI00232B58A3|nr:hypothetical protein [Bacillus sp. BP-3]MDC2863824.1 hypothetical protein [Bacillus sp. BP-3]
MEEEQIVRDENGYVIKVNLTKEQWGRFLKPLIPAARELILKRRLEQKQLQNEVK